MLESQLAQFEPLEEIPAHARGKLTTVASPADLAVELESLVDAALWPAQPTGASAEL